VTDLSKPPGHPVEWEIWWRDGAVIALGETAFEAHKNAPCTVPAFGECLVSRKNGESK
jgi:hypothetical protein